MIHLHDLSRLVKVLTSSIEVVSRAALLESAIPKPINCVNIRLSNKGSFSNRLHVRICVNRTMTNKANGVRNGGIVGEATSTKESEVHNERPTISLEVISNKFFNVGVFLQLYILIDVNLRMVCYVLDEGEVRICTMRMFLPLSMLMYELGVDVPLHTMGVIETRNMKYFEITRMDACLEQIFFISWFILIIKDYIFIETSGKVIFDMVQKISFGSFGDHHNSCDNLRRIIIIIINAPSG